MGKNRDGTKPCAVNPSEIDKDLRVGERCDPDWRNHEHCNRSLSHSA